MSNDLEAERNINAMNEGSESDQNEEIKQDAELKDQQFIGPKNVYVEIK